MKFYILSEEVAGKQKKRIQTVTISCRDWDDFVLTISDILSEPRTSGYVPVCDLETRDDGDTKVMHIRLQLTRHMANKLSSE